MTVEYSWDHRNRLTAVVFKDGQDVVVKRVRYTYDVNDMRIATEIDANADGTYESVERYALDGEHVAMVFDDGGSLAERYLYGPGEDTVLAADIADSGQFATHWYLADHQGSVRDVVDDGGVSLDHIVYDSFGKIVSRDNAALPLRFGYTGRELAGEAGEGMYYYRRRFYDAPTGRFLSQDPAGFAAGDNNLYRYVNNDPLDYTDPSGLCGENADKPWYDRAWDWATGPTSDSHLEAFGQGLGDMVVGLGTSVKEIGLVLYDTVRGVGASIHYGVTGDPNLLSSMEMYSEFAGRGGKPRFAEIAENTYKKQGMAAAIGSGAYEFGRAVPVFGTGMRIGDIINDTIKNRKWTPDNTRSLGSSTGEVAMIVLAARAAGGKIRFAGRGKAPRVVPRKIVIRKGAGRPFLRRLAGKRKAHALQANRVKPMVKAPKSISPQSVNPRLTTRLSKWRAYKAGGGDMQTWVRRTNHHSWGNGAKSGFKQWHRRVSGIEKHHIKPKYLGGAANGPTVPLNKAYHQKITNEFRTRYPYGQDVPSPLNVQEIMQKVYQKYPLPPGAGQ
ncbi:MAG: RHS repeat-associated core domain-containing protein [Phycisphaerae bacterium]|nr:RHS repeat-associated core domain-containing protein [Phycisphaerae bacterium]